MFPAVILAAGKSSRMGRPKALLPFDEHDTFVTRLVRTFREAAVDDVIVVVGHDAELVITALESARLSPRIVVNPAYESGQLSSVLTGLAAVDRPGVLGMLMMLVDTPAVSADTIRAVVERFKQSGAPVVRPVNANRHGHPILLARSLFSLIWSADPAAGLKPVVRAHASEAGDVFVQDEGAFVDVDTPGEYERFLETYGNA